MLKSFVDFKELSMIKPNAAEMLKGPSSGLMSAEELRLCDEMRQLFGAALEGQIPFLAVMAKLRADFLNFGQGRLNSDSKRRIAEIQKHVRQKIQLSKPEKALLTDFDAIVDFALRNGLAFDSVNGLIGHDVSMLAAYGFDLRAATNAGCLPKSHGWTKKNAAPVGEAVEFAE